MKLLKFLLIFLLFGLTTIVTAQDQDLINNSEKKLLELKTNYKNLESTYQVFKDSLTTLKTKIDLSFKDENFNTIKALIADTNTIVDSLNAIKEKADIYIKYLDLELNNKPEGELNELISHFNSIDLKSTDDDKDQEQSTSKVLYYFGKDEVIAENDSIFNNPKYDKIFKNVLNAESKSYLGDFVIPQDGQQIKLVEVDLHWISSNKDNLKYFGNVYFKSLKLNVEHGLIQDIKIIVLDDDGNELLFENDVPVSLLKFSRIAHRNYMSFRTLISNNKNKAPNRDYKGFRLRLSDVLMYINNPGENYVPDDLRLEFPTKTDGKLDNLNNSVKYKIEQNTSLEHVLNLRAYTDFLGLFGDAPNGIVQIEGKADFYLAPFNLRNKHLYVFKKLSPFVNYARLDEEQKNIELQGNTIVNDLEILEKSFLNMGLDLDVVSFKIKKEFPFEATFYSTARYNISSVGDSINTAVNFKSLALGGGLRVDIKRFNNFGLTLKSEVTQVNTDELNTTFVDNPDNFSVFRNEAEIFYHPAENENQALFLRLTTFGNSSGGQREAFYQLQFGYRFSIGVSKLKR